MKHTKDEIIDRLREIESNIKYLQDALELLPKDTMLSRISVIANITIFNAKRNKYIDMLKEYNLCDHYNFGNYSEKCYSCAKLKEDNGSISCCIRGEGKYEKE